MRDPINPWDRRVGETSYAYRAFIIYRDLGAERSQAKLIKAEPLFNAAQVNDWSRSHDWVDRAGSWDDAMQRLADDALRAGVIELKRKIAEFADRGMAVALAKLEALEANPSRLTASEMVKIAEFCSRAGLMAAGEATDRVEHKVAGLSPERLWALVQENPNVADDVERLERMLTAKVDA